MGTAGAASAEYHSPPDLHPRVGKPIPEVTQTRWALYILASSFLFSLPRLVIQVSNSRYLNLHAVSFRSLVSCDPISICIYSVQVVLYPYIDACMSDR